MQRKMDDQTGRGLEPGTQVRITDTGDSAQRVEAQAGLNLFFDEVITRFN